MRLLLALSALPLFGAVANYHLVGTSNTQAVVSFSVDSPAACTIVLYTDSARTTPVIDTDAALFTGSTACNRTGNVATGGRVTAVIGQRTVAAASDGKNYSRALAANEHYWGRITDTGDSDTLDFEFTTGNIPWGLTYNEPLKNTRPYLDPSNATPVIDPDTGAKIYRLTLAKDIIGPHTLTHVTPAAASGWTNPGNVIADDSSSATLTGSTTPLFVAISDTAIGNAGAAQPQNHGYYTDNGLALNTFSVLLNAWRDGGTVDLQIALSVDGGITAATNYRTVTLATCTSSCTTGNRITTAGTTLLLGDWTSTALPSFDVTKLAKKAGTATVSGATVTWASGEYFDPLWAAGATITVNGSACAIASVDSDKQITLTGACGSSGAWSIEPFGVLVKASASTADTISVQYISSTVNLGFGPEWDSGGLLQGHFTCSPVIVSGGRLCYSGPGLYWFNVTTGERHFLAIAQLTYDGSADGWLALWCTNWAWDATNGNKGYCYQSSTGKLISATYSGDYADVGPQVWYTGNLGTSGDWALANVLPPSTGKDLPTQFDGWSAGSAAFVAQYGSVGYGFVAQRGAYAEFVVRPAGGYTNDTTGWAVMVELATGNMVAASPPSRWSGTHGGEAIDVDGWTILSDVTHRGPWWTTETTDGNGPYQATVATQMLAGDSTTCPAWPGSGVIPEAQWPVTASGGKCATLVTSGQPADPSPGTNESAGYRPYDVAPGDLLAVCPPGGPSYANMAGCYLPAVNTEVMRILQVTDDTHWVVQRGYAGPNYTNNPQNLRQHDVSDWIFMLSSSCNVGVTYGCDTAGNKWNFAVDANGPTSMLFDPDLTGGGHQFISGGWHIASSSSIAPTIDGSPYNSYNERYGATIPALLAATNTPVSQSANFAGKVGAGSGLTVESHPSCIHCPVDNSFFVDARPFLGEAALTGCTVDSGLRMLCGTLGAFRPKYLPTIATIGNRVLTDVSGPSSTLGTTSADAYKICVAVLADECKSGSTPGDVYVNRGTSTQTECHYQGVGGTDMDTAGICVADNGSFTQGITQTKLIAGAEATGARTRVLTHGFSGYYRTAQFWNVKSDPSGQWAFFQTRWASGIRDEVLAVKVPPMDAPTYRPGFKYVAVKVTASPTSGYARVRFGYDASFRCTTDTDACVTGGTPWSYLRENPTPTTCTSGCTINVPAIPGRPLYYRVDRTLVDGTLVIAGATQVAIP